MLLDYARQDSIELRGDDIASNRKSVEQKSHAHEDSPHTDNPG
jgi:hypothetical protein